MKPDLSATALIQLLRRYYPTGLWVDEPGYKESEQIQRLQRFLEEARKDTRAWTGFVQRVRQEFPGSTLWDSTLLFYDPCYRLRVSLPLPKEREDARDELVCLVSLLAPAYVIYASHALNTGVFAEAWTRYPPLPPGFQPDETGLPRSLSPPSAPRGCPTTSSSPLFRRWIPGEAMSGWARRA